MVGQKRKPIFLGGYRSGSWRWAAACCAAHSRFSSACTERGERGTRGSISTVGSALLVWSAFGRQEGRFESWRAAACFSILGRTTDVSFCRWTTDFITQVFLGFISTRTRSLASPRQHVDDVMRIMGVGRALSQKLNPFPVIRIAAELSRITGFFHQDLNMAHHIKTYDRSAMNERRKNTEQTPANKHNVPASASAR